MKETLNNKLLKDYSKSIVITPRGKVSDSDSIAKIVQPIEIEIDTVGTTNKTKIIHDIDKLSNKEFIDQYIVNKTTNANSILQSLNKLTEGEIKQITNQERKIRNIENERKEDFNKAITDEAERRELFKRELEVKNAELNLYMKRNYKDIVGNRFIKDGDSQSVYSQIVAEKQRIQTKKDVLIKRKVERLEREKRRKDIENSTEVSKLIKRAYSSFFEEDVLMERRQKLQLNPEIRNLTDVQKLLQELEIFELQYGKNVSSPRDIIESEESDFDINTNTSPNDILILTDHIGSVRTDIEKSTKLIQLKMSLDNKGDVAEYNSKSKYNNI